MLANQSIPRRRGRPPRSLAASQPTREELLRAGVEILTQKGYTATGIDEILRHAGVPKGSFYHYFSSKQAFGHAIIDAYHQYFLRKLQQHLEDPLVPPLQRIKNFIEDARQGMARHRFTRGCLIGNLGQEMSALPDEFRGQLQQVLGAWEQCLEHCLLEAARQRQIADCNNSKELSRAFWTGWEGAVLRARLEQNNQPLDDFSRLFFAALTPPVHL
jgi:TetR/AcrR family transcriptional repressor of nem operon